MNIAESEGKERLRSYAGIYFRFLRSGIEILRNTSGTEILFILSRFF
jgi:hypothetical protein